MYHLSKTGIKRRETLDPELKVLADEILLYWDYTLICGHRNRRAQNKAVADGLSQLSWPDSKHNGFPSEAMDIGPYSRRGGLDWNDSGAFYMFIGKLIEIARRLKAEGRMTRDIRVGADWDGDGQTVDQRFHDIVHVELV